MGAPLVSRGGRTFKGARHTAIAVAFVVPALAFVWFVPATRSRLAPLAAELVGPFVPQRLLLLRPRDESRSAHDDPRWFGRGLTHAQFASLLSLPPAEPRRAAPAIS